MTTRKTRSLLSSFGACLLAGAVFFNSTLRAADHGDGPASSNDPTGDIGDVYLFLDPNDNTRVVVAMTMRGFLVPGEGVNFGIFDPSILYRLSLETTGDAVPDATINVTFSPRTSNASAQEATVTMTKGSATVFSFTAPATNPSLDATGPAQVVTTNAASGVQFFAGMVDDPFFFDIPAFSRFIASVSAGAPNAGVFSRARDSFAGYNTMAFALSIPKALIGAANNSVGAFGTTLRASKHFDPSVINLSTRGRIDTGESVLINGFVISGNASKRIVIRGLGPSLSRFGVAGAVANPTLALYGPGSTPIATNDNWQDSQAAEITASGYAPTDTREAAIIATLAPGAYTVIAAGAAAGTGVGLVEVFDLNTGAPGVVDFGSLTVIDRMGGPAVNVALVPFAKKDPYNQATPANDAAGLFAADIVGTLKFLGTNDTNIGILAGVAVTNGDILRLNLNTANTGSGGGTTAGVGFPNGRRLGDDTIDTLLFFIANQTALKDNVDANDVPLQSTFPFFARAQQPRDNGVAEDNTRN